MIMQYTHGNMFEYFPWQLKTDQKLKISAPKTKKGEQTKHGVAVRQDKSPLMLLWGQVRGASWEKGPRWA